MPNPLLHRKKMNSPIVSMFDVPLVKKEEKKKERNSRLRYFDSLFDRRDDFLEGFIFRFVCFGINLKKKDLKIPIKLLDIGRNSGNS